MKRPSLQNWTDSAPLNADHQFSANNFSSYKFNIKAREALQKGKALYNPSPCTNKSRSADLDTAIIIYIF